MENTSFSRTLWRISIVSVVLLGSVTASGKVTGYFFKRDASSKITTESSNDGR